MTAPTVIAEARRILAAERESSPLEALLMAAGSDRDAVATALELLDAVTPHPLTFLLWADRATATGDGEAVGFMYTYNRPVAEVMAVMGKACLRASRAIDGWGSRTPHSRSSAPTSGGDAYGIP